MNEKRENTVVEAFIKGLDAMCLGDKPRFSSKSKEVKEVVKEGVS